MNDTIARAVDHLLNRRDLAADEMESAVAAIMEGTAGDVAIAAFLTALAMKGETSTELAGAARAMSGRATRISTTRSGLLDTCGTGGTGLSTFNISTAVAITAAAAGAPVAKHGNRGATSPSGSADVLEALGVNISLSAEAVGRCIDEVGIGFCYARLVHGAMKHVAPVRKELGFRTIFNLLGPLTNPAGAEFQLLGTGRVSTARTLANALAELGTTRALVVCGADQLDEVSLWGETTVFVVKSGAVAESHWTAEIFGLPECRVEDVRAASPEESAGIIRSVFANEGGPCRDVVVANTAAALIAAGRCATPESGAAEANRVLETGTAAETLARLVEFSNQNEAS